MSKLCMIEALKPTNSRAKSVVKRNFYFEGKKPKRDYNKMYKTMSTEPFIDKNFDKLKPIPKTAVLKHRFSLGYDNKLSISRESVENIRRSVNFILMNDIISVKQPEHNFGSESYRMSMKKWTFPKNGFLKKRKSELCVINGLKIEAVQCAAETSFRPISRAKSIQKRQQSIVYDLPRKVEYKSGSKPSKSNVMHLPIKIPYKIEFEGSMNSNYKQDITAWEN